MKNLNLKIGAVIVIAVITAARYPSQTEIHMNVENTTTNAVQFRIARPTNNLRAVVRFYKEGLGLNELGAFEGHRGYDGVMLGLPDTHHHLEFTQHEDKATLPPPTKENLIVFYFDTPEKYKEATQRMERLGVHPIEPENPYWVGKSETYEDPDQWRVILFNGVYKP